MQSSHVKIGICSIPTLENKSQAIFKGYGDSWVSLWRDGQQLGLQTMGSYFILVISSRELALWLLHENHWTVNELQKDSVFVDISKGKHSQQIGLSRESRTAMMQKKSHQHLQPNAFIISWVHFLNLSVFVRREVGFWTCFIGNGLWTRGVIVKRIQQSLLERVEVLESKWEHHMRKSDYQTEAFWPALRLWVKLRQRYVRKRETSLLAIEGASEFEPQKQPWTSFINQERR